MKITVIGAGNVGSLTALRLAQEDVAEIVLVDVVRGIAQGKAFDMQDAASLVKTPYVIGGTQDIAEVSGSEIVIMTAGLARKPGMTREELLHKNAQIMREVCRAIKEHAPEAVVVVVTNPLDIMTNYCLRETGFPWHRVIGMGVSLDAARFANIIARELRIPATDVDACVIGSHGEGMMPLARCTTVNNISLDELLPEDTVQSLITRTVNRGAEIVSLLGSGSAYFAPSAAAAALARAIARDEKRVIGVCGLLKGEYGVRDVCIGVPARIGRRGIEEIIELPLSEEERAQFAACADKIRAAAASL